MKWLWVAFLLSFSLSPLEAAEEYLSYQTRIDEYPGSGQFTACKGRLELMPNCVVDADTIRIDYQSYRIEGIDTPESRGGTGAKTGAKCDAEKELGLKAKDFVIQHLNRAILVRVTVFIHPLKKDVVRDKYGRVLARIAADGADIKDELIKATLAHHYDGGTKTSWCP